MIRHLESNKKNSWKTRPLSSASVRALQSLSDIQELGTYILRGSYGNTPTLSFPRHITCKNQPNLHRADQIRLTTRRTTEAIRRIPTRHKPRQTTEANQSAERKEEQRASLPSDLAQCRSEDAMARKQKRDTLGSISPHRILRCGSVAPSDG